MTRALRALVAISCFVAAVAVSSGCGATAVKPWDRDLLAQKKMRFNPSPHETATDDHIYFSKEGSIGGQEASGGGCGCN